MLEPGLTKFPRDLLPLQDPQQAGGLLLGKQPGAALEASWEVSISCFRMVDTRGLQQHPLWSHPVLRGQGDGAGASYTPCLPTPTQAATEPDSIATAAGTWDASRPGQPHWIPRESQPLPAGVRAAPTPCALTINSPLPKLVGFLSLATKYITPNLLTQNFSIFNKFPGDSRAEPHSRTTDVQRCQLGRRCSGDSVRASTLESVSSNSDLPSPMPASAHQTPVI